MIQHTNDVRQFSQWAAALRLDFSDAHHATVQKIDMSAKMPREATKILLPKDGIEQADGQLRALVGMPLRLLFPSVVFEYPSTPIMTYDLGKRIVFMREVP